MGRDLTEEELLKGIPLGMPGKKGTNAKGGCEFPDCPSRWMATALISELKVIQEHQKDQKDIQSKMLLQQGEAIGFERDIRHAEDDLKRLDGRITDAFRMLAEKSEKKDEIQQENLITKTDMIKLMAFALVIITATFTLLEYIVHWFKGGTPGIFK
jgi:hypothetical protein